MTVRPWCIGVALQLALVAIPARGENEMLEQRFNELRALRGRDYAAARDRFLDLPSGLSEWLDAKQRSGRGGDEGWLAEVLLSRAEHADEFERLTGVFDEYLLRLNSPPGPLRTPAGPRPYHEYMYDLYLPDEVIPHESDAGRELGPYYKDYLASLQLPNSTLWAPFLGEVVLKGWAPDIPPPRGMGRPLTENDYMRQALILLAKLGDQRAAPHARRILNDPDQIPHQRAAMARVLGKLQDSASLDDLMKYAADPATDAWLHHFVFEAIGDIGDPRALQALEQIVERPPAGRPGGFEPTRFASEARKAIRKIQAAQSAPPGEP